MLLCSDSISWWVHPWPSTSHVACPGGHNHASVLCLLHCLVGISMVL
uniref:Uncharacterized protein n=1 Tax=Anguilla anguilla TaxID=7936 RepID=A0A0E9SJ54_ANGAN